MAHFAIILPGNIHAHVSRGKVFNKQISITKAWPFFMRKGQQNIGYVVKINYSDEYLLIKQDTGKWNTDQANNTTAIKKDGRWVPVKEDSVITAIKTAIDSYENK